MGTFLPPGVDLVGLSGLGWGERPGLPPDTDTDRGDNDPGGLFDFFSPDPTLEVCGSFRTLLILIFLLGLLRTASLSTLSEEALLFLAAV